MREKAALVVLFGTLLAAGSGLTGCATTGVERAAKTTNTMQTVESQYRQIASQTDATNASLRDLVSPNQPDLKKAFEAYGNNVEKMEKLSKRLEKDSAEMSVKGQDYFAEWEKQGATYTNPQMRQLSADRRLQLSEMFTQIPAASVEVKKSLLAYMNDIRDIRKYLSNDLTSKGVQNIMPAAQRALQDGEAVQESVNPVLATIQRVRTAMTPGGTTGSAAGGEQQPQEQMQQPQEPMQQPQEQMENQ